MPSSWFRAGRRDRHQRGLRGPVALPNRWTGRPVRVPQPPSKQEAFARAVGDAMAAVAASCPVALNGITVTMEDVPALPATWGHRSAPLAAAVEAPDGKAARVVLYRRPLELRSASTEGLRILVRRTLVEQLSVVTGLSPAEIDPEPPYDDE